MKKIILLMAMPIIAMAGFDGSNTGGAQVGGASGGYNYIGRDLQTGKPTNTKGSGENAGKGSPRGGDGTGPWGDKKGGKGK